MSLPHPTVFAYRLLLQVLREGEWSEHVSSALAHLGCQILDTNLLTGAVAASSSAGLLMPLPAALQRIVQQPTLLGVLRALTASAAAPASGPLLTAGSAAAAPASRQGAGSLMSAGAQSQAGSVEAATQGVAGLFPEQRRQLRGFLLQSKWFSGECLVTT